jgi:hypothetical protein
LSTAPLQVIHKNYHYRDTEKYRLVEKIASVHVKMEAYLAKIDAEERAKLPHQRLPRLGMPEDKERLGAEGEDDDFKEDKEAAVDLGLGSLGGVDMIQRVGFRKGREYWEAETERLLSQQTGEVVADSKYVQGETDWNVEAVADEDQL